jgi:hypothetical protein
MSRAIEVIDDNDEIEFLLQTRYREWIKILLTNPELYTKNGKLKKSAACKMLGIKIIVLESFLENCKGILG